MGIAISVLWIGFAGLVGYAAHERGRSALGWGLLSLVLGPLIGMVALLAATYRTDSTQHSTMAPSHTDSDRHAPNEEAPPWVGYWRVRRYDGEAPAVPTYYVATPESWDVVKEQDTGLHVARHPILEIRSESDRQHTLILKDEGAPDDEAERWRVSTDGDRVRVVAATGPHEGAVGRAARIQTDPREPTGSS